jgi:hypothetical protein
MRPRTAIVETITYHERTKHFSGKPQTSEWMNEWVIVYLTSGQIYHGENRLDYKIGICCFSAKRTALSTKSTDGLARNRYNVSEERNVYI